MGTSLLHRFSSTGPAEVRHQYLAEMALQLELEVVAPGRAQGWVLGTEVRLVLGGPRELLARIRISTPLPLDFLITSKRAVSARRLPKRYRIRQVGIPEFDACMHAQARNAAATLRILRSAELRHRLPALLEAHPELRVVEEEVLLPLPSGLDAGEGRRMVKEAVALAEALGLASAAEEDRVIRRLSEVDERRARQMREESSRARASPASPSPQEEPTHTKAYLVRVRNQYLRRVVGAFVLRLVPFLILFFPLEGEDRIDGFLLGLLSIVPLFLLSYTMLHCPACGAFLPEMASLRKRKWLPRGRCAGCHISFWG